MVDPTNLKSHYQANKIFSFSSKGQSDFMQNVKWIVSTDRPGRRFKAWDRWDKKTTASEKI